MTLCDQYGRRVPAGPDAGRSLPATLRVRSPADHAREFANRPEEWLHRVRFSAEGRWYERIRRDETHEVWLIAWLPGQSTGLHDHGASEGAFVVALGTLEEHGTNDVHTLSRGRLRAFGPGHVHDVRNGSDAPAVSVHVYSPPLSRMNRYGVAPGGRLIVLATETAGDW